MTSNTEVFREQFSMAMRSRASDMAEQVGGAIPHMSEAQLGRLIKTYEEILYRLDSDRRRAEAKMAERAGP